MAAVVSFEYFDPVQYILFTWLIWLPGFLMVILRLVLRYGKLKRLMWDDGFAIAGLICLTIMALINQYQRDYLYMEIDVIANPTTLKPPFTTKEAIEAVIIDNSKLEFVFVMVFFTCLWCNKASLLMLYRRLFVGLNGNHMKWWWVVVIVCILGWVGSLLANILLCIPVWRRWTVNIADVCSASNGRNATTAGTIMDIGTDLLVMILPIRLLVGLRITTAQKIGVGGIFCICIAIIIIVLIRLVSLLQSFVTNDPRSGVDLELWSMLEGSAAVIVSSLPTLKSIILRKGDTENSTRRTSDSRLISGGDSTAKKKSGDGTPQIRLQSWNSGGVETQVSATFGNGNGSGSGSDEVLHKGSVAGIMKTQEFSVSSHGAFERVDVDKSRVDSVHLVP